MKIVDRILSLFFLAACLAAPVFHFLGSLSQADYKLILAIGSLGWFVFATRWVSRRTRT